jgi:hypothetical protein
MRKITMVFLLLAALLVSLSANAQRAAADNLLTECQQVSKALDAKHPNQYAKNQGEASFSAGQCEGYLQGWVESADGSYRVTKEGKVILVHVDIGSIKSYWDIAVALQKNLSDNPLDKGKTADSILEKVLFNAGVLHYEQVKLPVSLTPDTDGVQASEH